MKFKMMTSRLTLWPLDTSSIIQALALLLMTALASNAAQKGHVLKTKVSALRTVIQFLPTAALALRAVASTIMYLHKHSAIQGKIIKR